MFNYGKGKRWMSEDAASDSKNLRVSPYTNKTTQWGDVKVWWFVVLCKGKVHIEVMGQEWHQDSAGQAQFVKKLPKIMKKMHKGDDNLPSVVFTDRGPGFYHPSTGSICPDYQAALAECGLSAWAGDHSKWQPPDIADVLLHETSVAWIRKFMRQHPVKITSNLAQNISNLEAKLQKAQQHINSQYEVEDRGQRKL